MKACVFLLFALVGASLAWPKMQMPKVPSHLPGVAREFAGKAESIKEKIGPKAQSIETKAQSVLSNLDVDSLISSLNATVSSNWETHTKALADLETFLEDLNVTDSTTASISQIESMSSTAKEDIEAALKTAKAVLSSLSSSATTVSSTTTTTDEDSE